MRRFSQKKPRQRLLGTFLFQGAFLIFPLESFSYSKSQFSLKGGGKMNPRGTDRLEKALLFSAAIILIFLSFPAQGEIPKTISYQGYLTNASGVPVDGTLQMNFTIFNVPSGGGAIWAETQMNVPVINGIYNVILGTINPISLPFDIPYYLGVTVEGEPLLPRKAIASVGYAFRAYTVDIVPSHVHSGADITTGTVSESRIDAAIARTAALTAHTANTNNPHATTAAQVGAAAAVHDHAGVYVGINQANSITTSMIVDGTIAAADLASSSVTKPKLSAGGGTAGQVLGTDGTNLVWQTPAAASGWVDDGGVVRLATATDWVGIGTSTPQQNLDIRSSGNTFVGIDRGLNQHSGISYKEAGATQWIFPMFRGYQSDNLIVRDEANLQDTMIFQAQTGNVGIGMTGGLLPTARLDVNGQLRIRNNNALVFADASGTPYPENWIGMVNNIEGTKQWLHIGGITDSGTGGDNVRRLALFADKTYFNGSVAIGKVTPSLNYRLDVEGNAKASGNLNVVGRITKEYASGRALGAVPVAYGSLMRLCAIHTGTENFHSGYNAGENACEIVIDGEAYADDVFFTLVTFKTDDGNEAVRIAQTRALDGKLAIYIKDIWGNIQNPNNDYFSADFVVFKK